MQSGSVATAVAAMGCTVADCSFPTTPRGQPKSVGGEESLQDRALAGSDWAPRQPGRQATAPSTFVRHLGARPAPPTLLGGGPKVFGDKAGPQDPHKTGRAAPPPPPPPASPRGALLQDPRAARIARETAEHYGLEVCVAWAAGAGGTRMAVCHGLDAMPALPFGRPQGAGFDLFHHHVDRDLPVVILDLARDTRAAGHPLVEGGPKLRFYAAAPLVRPEARGSGGGRYPGTLTVAGPAARDRFTLADCTFLEAQAELLAGILRELEAETKVPATEDSGTRKGSSQL